MSIAEELFLMKVLGFLVLILGFNLWLKLISSVLFVLSLAQVLGVNSAIYDSTLEAKLSLVKYILSVE
jgi:hypothetical protein